MLSLEEMKRVGEEWAAMSPAQKEELQSKVLALRVKARKSEPFKVRILETWRLNSDEICEESWNWYPVDDYFGEGVSWAVEAAYLERLFSPQVMAWEAAQRHVEAALSDPLVCASPVVRGMFEVIAVVIDDNSVYGPDVSNVWEGLISNLARKQARTAQARLSAMSKNANPRNWVFREWGKRTDQGQSKAAFARQYSALVKAKFGIEVTPETIARDWLPKGIKHPMHGVS